MVILDHIILTILLLHVSFFKCIWASGVLLLVVTSAQFLVSNQFGHEGSVVDCMVTLCWDSKQNWSVFNSSLYSRSFFLQLSLKVKILNSRLENAKLNHTESSWIKSNHLELGFFDDAWIGNLTVRCLISFRLIKCSRCTVQFKRHTIRSDTYWAVIWKWMTLERLRKILHGLLSHFGRHFTSRILNLLSF